MRKVKLTGDTLIIGKRGSGKSFLAVRLAIEDDADEIVSNIPLDLDRVNLVLKDIYKEPPKRLRLIEHPREFLGLTCGYRLLDEVQKYFPARAYKDVDAQALQAIYEERKDDAATCYTAQMLRTVDVITAGFCDQVIRCSMVSFPFIGWFWPKCVRPSVICKVCGRLRRDGLGDQHTFLRRLLGFGSYIRWDVIDPELVVKQRTLEGSAQPDDDPAVIGHGRCLFNIDIANCYDSGQKVGFDLKDAKPKRGICPSHKEDDSNKLPF